MAERLYALTVQVLVQGQAGQPSRVVVRRFARGLSWQEARQKRADLYALSDSRHKRRPNVQIVPDRDAGEGVPLG